MNSGTAEQEQNGVTMPRPAASTLPTPSRLPGEQRAGAPARRSCARRPWRTPPASAASAPSACRRRRSRPPAPRWLAGSTGSRATSQSENGLELAVDETQATAPQRAASHFAVECRLGPSAPDGRRRDLAQARRSCGGLSVRRQRQRGVDEGGDFLRQVGGRGGSAPIARRGDRPPGRPVSASPCGGTCATGSRRALHQFADAMFLAVPQQPHGVQAGWLGEGRKRAVASMIFYLIRLCALAHI